MNNTPQHLQHFCNITQGSEYNKGTSDTVTRWSLSRPLRIQMVGTYNSRDIDTVLTIIEELMELTGLKIYITKETSSSNVLMFFGNSLDYSTMYDNNILREPNAKAFFTYRIGVGGEIVQAKIFIRSNLEGIERDDIMKEELTQILGFPNDSVNHRDSIFYQYKYRDKSLYTYRYSILDQKVIKMLYTLPIGSRHICTTRRYWPLYLLLTTTLMIGVIFFYKFV